MTTSYAAVEPKRDEVDAWAGATVLEFGTPWCGFCRAAEKLIAGALTDQELRHVKVEDGPGRPLGRSFRVKLWPTLVFLRDGKEMARVVRPQSASEVSDALARISG